MIGKQTKGRGFRGALDYVLNPEKGILIGGNMDGKTPRELGKEFAESRMLNPDLQRPVYHVSLSLSPGEHADDFTWNEIADRYMQRMGFESSQYVVARHTDRDHEHIHIVASRIGLDGKTVSDSNDYYRSEQLIREIEKEFGLERVLSSHERDIEDQKKALSAGELHKALETGTPNVKMVLQNHIDVAATYNVTMTDFVKHLERQGVQVIPNMADNGRVSGLSYRIDGQNTVKGSKLGKAYTFNGLQKRGISYNLDRDRAAFALARAKAGVKLAVTKEPEKAPQPTPSHGIQQTVSQIQKAVVRDAAPTRGSGVRVRIHNQELDR
ncbi:relaxase/mobilization nuclease domain-containing protein [Geobacter sulfurreducens]|uniref:relaxase/mobilization nuclease domain-containing protein n=1 Tax=Geobacter sulfurreducens TaxID=35554 RepID=UPI0020B76966|nr:relaxase/mobilization nuclease domain-containing protein [Geobacter sulfurreducens]UTG93167.1 relaxase/mobilization nuclease domain-containing protein [Geobacter sulfurreducens]